MKLKCIFVGMALFAVVGTFGQTYESGNVLAIIPVGNQSYCVIKESNVENYYKTGLYNSGDLTQGQQIQLQFNTNGTIQVNAQSLQTALYCELMTQGTLNDDWIDLLREMPEEHNGILWFEDTSHLRLFYEEVGAAISAEDQDIDEMLDLLEYQFPGFSSYRTWFNNEYDWLDGEFTRSEIEEISAKDFINDEIQKTFLNADRMIGVGDSVYYMFSKNIIMAVYRTNSTGIATLAALANDYDVYGIGSVVLSDSTIHLIAPLYDPGSGPKGVAVVTDSLYYESDPQVENINCDAYTKEIAVLVSEYLTTPSGQSVEPHLGGTLIIDWGDGTSPQVVSNYQGLDVPHVYAAMDTYYPTTMYIFTTYLGGTDTLTDGVGTSGEEIEIVVDAACTTAEVAQWDAAAMNGFMITTKIWIDQNILCKRVGAYTHSWKLNNSGNWERHKADIYAGISAIFRDVNCTFKKLEVGNDFEHLQKKVQKTKYKWWDYYDMENGDITSGHYMVKGSTFINVNMVVNPC